MGFPSGALISEIRFSGLNHLIGMCLWDNKNLLISTSSEQYNFILKSKIDLIDLKYKCSLGGFLKAKCKCFCTLTKIYNPKYKDCLIFHCNSKSIVLCKIENYNNFKIRNVTYREKMDFESFFEEYKKTHKNIYEKDNNDLLDNNMGKDIDKEKLKKKSKKCSIY